MADDRSGGALPGVPADEPDDDDGEPVDGETWLARLGEVEEPGRRARWVVLGPLAAGAVVAVVAGVGTGVTGVVGAVASALVVVAFFASSAVPLRLTALLGDAAAMGLLLLVLNYAFRLVAATLVLLVLVRAGAADRGSVGIAVIVCSLVRVNAQVLVLGRSRPGSVGGAG